MARKSKFQRTLERRRNILERRGRKMMFSALSAQYKWFFRQINKHSPKQLLKVVDDLPEAPVKLQMTRYYRTMAPLANMYRKDMEKQADKKSIGLFYDVKNAEDDFWINEYEKFLTNFVRTEAAWKITAITETTKKRLIRDIQGALRVGVDEGLGIEEISKLIRKNAGASLGTNAKARSLSIAQTEIISGSNQGALYAADKTKLKYKGFWSTAALPNTRESHSFAEQWSIDQGGVDKGKQFWTGANWLIAPGDPNAPAEETVNCRCSLLIEVIV